MPYRVEKRGAKWVTVNSATGKVKGRHATRLKALAQMRLLYLVEHGGRPRRRGRR